MSRIVLLIAIGIGAWILYHFAKQKMQRDGRGYLIKLALMGLAGLLILAALTGKAHALFALVGAAIPFLGRLMPLLRFWPLLRQLHNRYRNQHPSSGNHSNVRTAWLTMTLDHDSGEVDGDILSGALAGRSLHSLSLAELQQFYAECRQHDPEAMRLLDAYIQRERAEEWQPPDGGGEQATGNSGNSGICAADAWQILGLAPGASRRDVIETHHRLMGKLHPDKGGSDYLASQINQARDLLLEMLEKK